MKMMSRTTFVWLMLALFFVSSGVVYAQSQSDSSSGKKVRVGKTIYDFEEVDILGMLKRPEGQSIVEAPEVSFKRLLDLDESFLPNIVRAADEF